MLVTVDLSEPTFQSQNKITQVESQPVCLWTFFLLLLKENSFGSVKQRLEKGNLWHFGDMEGTLIMRSQKAELSEIRLNEENIKLISFGAQPTET